MSTIVYQKTQSRLEHRLIEPLVFKHKFAQSKPKPFPNTEDEIKKNENGNENIKSFGGWGFLQSLTPPQTNAEKVYIHPIASRSSTTLSKQSLDMCTESLGNETGSQEFSSLSLMREKEHSVRPSRQRVFAKKLRNRSYPPPLSSSYNVQVRPHRENGRLVIKATAKTSPNDYFQTERGNGRLKLSLVREKNYVDGEEEEHVNGVHEWVGSISANNGKVGGEIEKKINRCHEERNEKSGISSWGPFLVATS